MFFLHKIFRYELCTKINYLFRDYVSSPLQISAGVPLTYYYEYINAFSCEKQLKDNFLDIPFSSIENASYRKNGFVFFNSFEEVFVNKYTDISGEKMQVRALDSGDVMNVTKEQFSTQNNLSSGKWNKLFYVGAKYYFASASYNLRIYLMQENGNINYYGNGEARD